MPTISSRFLAWCCPSRRSFLLLVVVASVVLWASIVDGLPTGGQPATSPSFSNAEETSPLSSTRDVSGVDLDDENGEISEVDTLHPDRSKRQATESDRSSPLDVTTTTVDPTYGMWSPENESHHNHSGNHRKGHGGVHVASWRWEYVKTPFIYTTFVITAGLCKIGYHHADFLSSIVPESCLLIILGTAVGGILYATGSENLLPQFDSRTFFLFLLPPIVLESAYSLHDRAFFGNLGTILLYAVVGTLLNCFCIGPALYGLSELGALGPLPLGALECLIFSALISAVDPVAVLAIFQEVGVHKALYFLVFGESLLNDAVTVVLYTMMVALAAENSVTAGQLGLGVVSFFCVSLGGLAIGLFMGTLTALVTKNTHNVRVVEPLAMLGVAYASYLLAEMVHFSGIISIIGCGLVQAQYAWPNISQKSYTTVKYFSKMLSAVCDTVIFLFLGMVLVNDQHVWNTAFVLWSTLLCLIFRFIGVLVLTYLANSFDRIRRINLEEQFIMGYGGLRGAVAFSLVIMLDKETVPHKDMFVTCTLFIVLFTVFIQGGTIKPLVNLLKIRLQTGDKHCLFVEINTKVVDSVMAGIEEITGSHGDNYWTHVLYHYDEKYLKKWLTRETNENALTRVYTKLVLADHFAHLYGPATVIEEHQPLKLIEQVEEMLEEEEEDDDMLSVTCSAMNDTNNKLNVDKSENRKASIQDSPPPQPKRRNTIVSPIASLRRRTTSSGPPAEDDPGKLLQKALHNNPYNKLHFKYNPNLVEDDHQELLTHLRARRLRARRLTLAAMSSLGSSPSSSTEDLRMNTGSQSLNLPGDARVSGTPMSPVKPASPINDQTISYLLERANRRRSIMSGKSTGSKMERANTIASGGSLVSSIRSKKGREAAREAREIKEAEESKRKLNAKRVNSTPESRVSFGSLESIGDVEVRSGSPIKRQATKKPVKDPKLKKSLTFDVSSLDNEDFSDIEETEESKF